jgi:hypothetical protein
MRTAFDYRHLARECLKEAAASKDVGRQTALRDIARLFTQTAANMESVSSQDNKPGPKTEAARADWTRAAKG